MEDEKVHTLYKDRLTEKIWLQGEDLKQATEKELDKYLAEKGE